ncbi:nuclear transport factor 2 family protein [Crossiella sp. SN42]|uniref:nuclear transport factor 2 family protein n=1 Tax=Crossiella sp. SN42 TaxID=2944808 RepID=UPI00207CF74B|nr:nuclear transport factor 2 family protein [Crossiella sp. SN42]MCO1579489.1 nuclear transport factor 2 family protein [Crossiella sp. SN42]
MPTIEDELAALRAQVRLLSDRAEIGALIDAYALSLDERRFDAVTSAALFTPEVRFDFPVGEQETLENYAEAGHAVMGQYELTQHVTANHVIDLRGDHASVRWNAIMTHVHLRETTEARGERPGAHFDVGAFFTATAVRTPGGWRFSQLSLRAGWTAGRPPLRVVRRDAG